MQIRVTDESLSLIGDDGCIWKTIGRDQMALDIRGDTALLFAALIQLAEVNAKLGSVGPVDSKGGQQLVGLQGFAMAIQRLASLIVTGQGQILEELKATRAVLESLKTSSGASASAAINEAVAAARGVVEGAMASARR